MPTLAPGATWLGSPRKTEKRPLIREVALWNQELPAAGNPGGCSRIQSEAGKCCVAPGRRLALAEPQPPHCETAVNEKAEAPAHGGGRAS